jgi:uncharacterized protein (DUF779 family)
MCFLDGEYLTGDGDVLLGDVDGAPFYIEATLDRALGHPSFVLDVAPGGPEGFSLGTVDGGHFVSRSDACLISDETAEVGRNLTRTEPRSPSRG